MQAIAPEKAIQYKRVGILSAMGNDFAIDAVGLTVFGNEKKSEPLDFGADDFFTEKLSIALSARYEVVNLTSYRATFLMEPKCWPGQNRLVAEDRPSVEKVAQRLMGSERLDAYIIISPAEASVRGTTNIVGGIGIVKLQRIVSDDFRLHAAYIVSVIDGHDFSITANMRAFPIGESGFQPLVGGALLNAPNAPVLPQFWVSPAANRAPIKALLDGLIAQSLPQTLRHAKLIE